MDVRQEDLANERPLNLFYLRLAQTLFVYNLFLGVVLCPHARGQLSGRIAWINRPSGPWRSLLRCSGFCLAFCIFPFPSEIWFWHIWFFKIVYCVCVWACACVRVLAHGLAQVWKWKDSLLVSVTSFHPGSWGSNSHWQAWQRTPSPVEPSCQLCLH